MSERQRGWTAANRKAIERFLRTVKKGDIAATDWDGTCIHNDIGACTFYHAILTGLIDFTKPTMLQKVEEALRRSAASHAKTEEQLRDHVKALAEKGTREARLELLGTVTAVYMSVLEARGPFIAFPWLACFYEGMKQRLLEHFAEEVLRKELKAVVGAYTAPTGPAEIWKNMGWRPRPQYLFSTGIRFYAAAIEFLSALADRGVKVFVVSASEETSVAVAVRASGVKAAGIIGQRVQIRNGIFGGRELRPVTALEGKIEALRLASGSDTAPVVVLGDTTNDVPLLNTATDLRILIDHGKPWFANVVSAMKGRTETLIQSQFIDGPNVYMGE